MIIFVTTVAFSLGNECFQLIQLLIIFFLNNSISFPVIMYIFQRFKSLYYIQLNVIWNLKVLSHSLSS